MLNGFTWGATVGWLFAYLTSRQPAFPVWISVAGVIAVSRHFHYDHWRCFRKTCTKSELAGGISMLIGERWLLWQHLKVERNNADFIHGHELYESCCLLDEKPDMRSCCYNLCAGGEASLRFNVCTELSGESDIQNFQYWQLSASRIIPRTIF